MAARASLTGDARTSAAKVVPPAVAAGSIRREAIEAQLAEALRRRLTVVVAGPGFGKSTLLASWSAGVGAAWYGATPADATLDVFARGLFRALGADDLSPAVDALQGPDARNGEATRAQAIGGLVCDELAERLHRDLVLVVDDVDEIGTEGGAPRLLEALSREAPERLHLVLASRSGLPFRVERLRGQGQLLEVTAGDLAFAEREVAELLERSLGRADTELVAGVLSATGGWPAAVRLAIETLQAAAPEGQVAALASLGQPGDALYGYLAAEVFARELPQVRELVRTVAPLNAVTPELCEALGVPDAAETVASLARRGLFLELSRPEAGGWFTLNGLVRGFALDRLAPSPADVLATRLRAAEWLESHEHLEEAVRALDAGIQAGDIARLLRQHGRTLLRRGSPEIVVEAAGRLPLPLRDATIEEVEGAARQILGDWEGALACFRRIAPDEGPLPAGVAWRVGLIYHFRGQIDEALRVYERGVLDGSSPRDEALLLAWHATAHWLRGDAEQCRSRAERAYAVAAASGDDQALAAAHTALAMLAALDGDPGANHAHYVRALEHAERAGDVLQLIRIHTNRASRSLEEGAYEDALAELDVAIPLAEAAGFASFRALALTNRGETRIWLGRYEEALTDLESARVAYERAGSLQLSYPLIKLCHLHLARGDVALARAAGEEAVAHADAAGDVQGIVAALVALALAIAEDEPDEAARLAERAVAYGPGMAYVSALAAASRVALARGERAEAARLADEAAAAARGRRERSGLAEALELQGLTAQSPEVALRRLDEARILWSELAVPLAEARVELEIARRSPAHDARAVAAEAEQAFRALGARRQAAAAAALLADLERLERPAVAITTLGGFSVLRDDEPVPLADWQSKKARDLLKILVARRGRPVPREVLMEALWPEDDPARVANRLSVALATLRTVLDPQKRFPPEHFVGGEKTTLRLELAHVAVDVERFLAAAEEGLRLRGDGRSTEAAQCLAEAEATYAGDFLEEDAYEDWAEPLREELKEAYVQVARAIADDAAARGDVDAAARHLLRVLERDPYDERAHLGLVAALAGAGRHGEARRFFRAYRARMDEIGVEAAPFPRP
jgi:ATP/maltotriose-dependent transcriptional regulator MalT/DNA-binding SARP family transcriptional activator